MISIGPLSIKTEVFVLLLAVFLIGVQYLLCWKGKNLLIRLLPVIVFSCVLAVFGVLGLTHDGWDGFGFLFLASTAVIAPAACGIGWALWGIFRKHC